jgi:c-di-GMP-binding flagellar brake protein YcgR
VSDLPQINCLVDLVLPDGDIFRSRVEDIDGKMFTVGAPLDSRANASKVGTDLEVEWVLDERRQAVDMRLKSLSGAHPPLWTLEVTSTVRTQSRRSYVRGGGGENADISHAAKKATGKVIDLSEGGVRLRVHEDLFERDQHVDVLLKLDGERLSVRGTVLFVRRHPQTASFDLIITYEMPEAVGRTIRSYVLKREMEARRRLRESVMNPG